MGTAALTALTVAVAVVACVCGSVTTLVMRRAGVRGTVGFGWGVVLGPVGVVIAVLAAEHLKRRPRYDDIAPWN